MGEAQDELEGRGNAMLLKDKNILVTGGTHGIGRSIVEACVREGASVVFSGRDERAANDILAEIHPPAGKVRFIRADLSDADACYALVNDAAGHDGKLDGLVNNAGVFPPGTVTDTSVDKLDWVLSVNIRAPFLLCQRAITYMKGGGSIVNIGSTHAQIGAPGIAAYAVSKGALRTLTSHIAYNYASMGIRANWVTVGWVLTEGDYAAQSARGLSDEEIRAAARQRIPSGRYQTGGEIADAVVFLLSDKAASHTDTDMRITGGFTPVFGASVNKKMEV